MCIDFGARQLKKKIHWRPLHGAVQPISAALRAQCVRISSPLKQSALKHRHKEWKWNHWCGEENIWVYIINQSTEVELEVWGENRQSAANRASSLFVSWTRKANRQRGLLTTALEPLALVSTQYEGDKLSGCWLCHTGWRMSEWWAVVS